MHRAAGPALRVGLTGGIAAGKSAVLQLLEAAGAVTLDADDLAREVVRPGTPGLAEIVAEFGACVVAADGTLDRARLGEIVFGDEPARRRLESLLHPRIRELADQRMSEAPRGSIVVYAVPLLAETGAASAFDAVILVDAPVDVRLTRLTSLRGMSEREARARLAAQTDDEARRAVATWVIDNTGSREELAARVEQVWSHLQRMAAGSGLQAELGQQVGEQPHRVGLDPPR